MPRLSVWFVRFSFVHLLIGLTFGGLILANKGFPFASWTWSLLPAHMESLLLGWMAQLAMGMAFWILPRFRYGAARGNVNFVWGALILLNVGIVMVAMQPLISMSWIVLTGRILETSSILLFILASWRRVKPMET
ncbi:MAG: hypothetical protein HZB18_10930 [Chloroflexi bacterium]|nr:hypothetical protein [Chloroflexota bacterium]